MNYITKDSGERQNFETGARRDTQTGKPRFDLIPVGVLRRWADLMARGAEKYGERNWELGMPSSRYVASLQRHLYAYLEGDRSEDHLAAVLFNTGAIMHFEYSEHDDLNGAGNGNPETTDYALWAFERPSTYVDAHGDQQFVSVNWRTAQLTLPGFPSAGEVGADPKCR